MATLEQHEPAGGRERATGGRAARVERRELRRAARHAGGAAEERERSALWLTWTAQHDYFYCLCLRWTRGNRHDAEDVMSTAAIKLMELDARALAGVQNPRSWISRVLHNLCADLGRKGLRARTIEEGWSTVGASAGEPTPDAQLHDTRVGQRVTAAVARLPECLRAVVVMRLVDGLAYKEIADHLGITSAAARKRAQLGRDELKVQLGEVFDTAPPRRGEEA